MEKCKSCGNKEIDIWVEGYKVMGSKTKRYISYYHCPKCSYNSKLGKKEDETN